MFPIHLNLGFRILYYYEGFYFLVAILAASWLIVRRLDQAGLNPEVFLANLPWVLLGAIVGARLFHFLFWDLHSVVKDPLGLFRVWEGGLSITGGLAGGGLAAMILFKRAKVDFWHYFAIASPAVLLGQALGRVGCFLNGDAFGVPTRLPWGLALPKFGTVVFPSGIDHQGPSEAWSWCVAQGFSSPSALRTVPLHPTQLYEALGDLVLAGLALLLIQALRQGDGRWAKVFWLHLGGYAILRFGLEALHGDRDLTIWAGMTGLQLGLAGFGLLAILMYLRPAAPSGRPA